MAQLLESVFRHIPEDLRPSQAIPYRGRPERELSDIFNKLIEQHPGSNHNSIVSRITADFAQTKLEKREVFLTQCLGLTAEEATVEISGQGGPYEFVFTNVKTKEKTRFLKDFLRKDAAKLLAARDGMMDGMLQSEGGKDLHPYFTPIEQGPFKVPQGPYKPLGKQGDTSLN